MIDIRDFDVPEVDDPLEQARLLAQAEIDFTEVLAEGEADNAETIEY